MTGLKLQTFCWSFLLLVSIAGVQAAATWSLPTPENVYEDLETCRQDAQEDDPSILRCLVEKLGLWTDAAGYDPKRIAKIFASHNQEEEVMLVVHYCNSKERRIRDPSNWAFEAYKCATAGQFGRWVKDYMKEKRKN
ncbi:uncharacterized protein Obp99d [Drosophila bipectinata]|uniref:uncharacterized protein Obp99d n=1 Tax=Drosophila bipectinata TaxID=42026 RepID=UPI001C8A6347|nr:uncharacterized protein LOC108127413 [Drosophila bipectinata]